MAERQKKSGTVSIENALLGVGRAARLKAIRHHHPVAVSFNGKAVLVYRDGRRLLVTPQILQGLKNGKA